MISKRKTKKRQTAEKETKHVNIENGKEKHIIEKPKTEKKYA